MENFLQSYWGVAVFTFILSFLLVISAIFIFPRIGLMDRPQKYGLSRAPIPYYGGLAIYFAFLISIFLFVPLERHVVGLLISASLIVILGFFDDLISLSPFLRLFVQFLAAVVLVVFGIGILSVNIPFFGVLDFNHWVWHGTAFLSAIFTVIWVMAVLNTMNFVDGVPGLSSGVSFIAGLTMFFLSINPLLHANLASQRTVAMIALIVSVLGLSFLIFDFPKPRILMGDSGSTFFGFLIATLAIFSGGKVATAFLVLGIPILDMIWVVLRRLYEKKPFWKGDLKHLHHRLLNSGFSERGVVLLYLAVTALFGFGAVVLVSSKQKLFMLISLTVLMVLLAVVLVFTSRKRNG